MKKIIFILGLLLCSCTYEHIPSVKTEAVRTKEQRFPLEVQHFTYEKHNYLMFSDAIKGSYPKLSVVHDPECPCHYDMKIIRKQVK